MKRSESSAHHLLGIYQKRLKMVGKGTTHPKPEVVAGMRRLVTGLSEMRPDPMIGLEIRDGKLYFKDAATGKLVAEIP
jgi:hypothetical protein